MSFLHGIEIKEEDSGPRPIASSNSAVIGIVGTASNGSAEAGKPVLIPGSRKVAVGLFGKTPVELIQEKPNTEPEVPVSKIEGVKESIKNLKDGLTVFWENAKKQISAGEDSKKKIKEFDAKLEKFAESEIVGDINKVTLIEQDFTTMLEYLGENFPGESETIHQESRTISRQFDELLKKTEAVTVPEDYDWKNDNTLPYALSAILEQTGAMIVAVKAASNSETDIKKAIEALKGAESVVGQCPRILIAPGFSHEKGVREALAGVAEGLRGIAVVDGNDNPDHTEVKNDIKDTYNNPRMYAVYPYVKVSCGEGCEREEPASARVAGVIAKSDAQRGFWFSPSNQVIGGIIGTKYAIDFALDNRNSTANQLNAGNVATIIQQNGYRLWGNRSCASGKWQFISVRRTADMINDALLRSHLWAVDRNITKTYVEDVTEGVNAYLRHLKSIGAIINGKCWAEIDKNTPDQIVQGKVVFSFDFTPPYPAEHIIFNSRLVNDYLVEIFA